MKSIIHIDKGDAMFRKAELSIGDWLLYFFLMSIPIVNIVIFLVVILNPFTNRTLWNMMITIVIVIPVLVLTIVWILGADFWEDFLRFLLYDLAILVRLPF